MVKASGQIEKELEALQDKTEVMESALDPLYEGYLKALSEAASRQLVMAAYYLCTQAYPDKFLTLSWDDRNRLQQSLQALSSQILTRLSEQREEAKKMSLRPQSADGIALLQRLLESRMASAASRDRTEDSEVDESRKLNRSTSELFDADEEDFVPSAEEDLNEPLDDDALDHEILEAEEREFENQPLDEDAIFNISALEVEDEDSEGDARFDARKRANIDGIEATEAVEDTASSDLRSSGDSEDDSEGEHDYDMHVPSADERMSIDDEEDLLAALEGLARRSMEIRGGASSGELDDDSEADGNKPLTPMQLAKRHMLLEKAIRDVFKAISEEANELLQKSNVMPSFPKALLAAATESGGIGDPANAVPNVVRVSVRVMHGDASMIDLEEDADERDEEGPRRSKRDRRSHKNREDSDYSDSRSRRSAKEFRSSKERSSKNARRRSRKSDGRTWGKKGGRVPMAIPEDMLQVEALPELSAISLRIGEVEFADPTVSAWRSKLRQKLGDLKQLRSRYRKTQRSLEVAKAEDAWRSSWTVRSSDADS